LSYDLDHVVIVTGEVHATSDSGINAILQVEQYLLGDGDNEYVVFERSSPLDISLMEQGRSPRFRCTYVGPQRQMTVLRFIAGLYRQETGTYYGSVVTEDAQGLFYQYNVENPDEPIPLDYERMLAYIETQTAGTPRLPQRSVRPRPVVVKLNTESGERYFLPVDQNVPFVRTQLPTLCHPYVQDGCTQTITAPNGVDTASFYPVRINDSQPSFYDFPYSLIIEGETGVFSRRSDLLMAWNGDSLSVIVTALQTSMTTSFNAPFVLRTYAADPNDVLITGAGAWHPNGRLFAFSTNAGVWLWDPLAQEQTPSLWVSANDAPIRVRFFSPQGNYLAVESGDTRYYIDMLTTETYPDGLISPDDRALAAFDTHADALTPLTLYSIVPNLLPIAGWGNSHVQVTQFEWVEDGYIYASCGEGNPYSEDPRIWEDWCAVRITGRRTTWVDGIAFDYDPLTNSLVTLVDQDSITINGERINFETGAMSAITSVEFGQPVIDLDYRSY